jgi:hypothetical protein
MTAGCKIAIEDAVTHYEFAQANVDCAPEAAATTP